MKTIETIMQEINQVMELVDEQELDQAMPLIQKNKRVFVIRCGSKWLSGKRVCYAFDAYRLYRLCYG